MKNKLPHPNFLEDYERYQQVEKHWESLFSRICEEKGWEWAPWMEPVFADGAPFFDGNPIFNAYVPDVKRGVRILQIEPEESDEFSFYQDSVELPDGETFPELVISLILTEDTHKLAEKTIRRWLSEGKTDEK